MGDPRRGGTEPPDLQIPAFEPTGDPVVDTVRLAKWQARIDEVRTALNAAVTTDDPKPARTRKARQDEHAGYRRDAGWLFEHRVEHRAAGSSFRTIAMRDLGSSDRWRDVQKATGVDWNTDIAPKIAEFLSVHRTASTKGAILSVR